MAKLKLAQVIHSDCGGGIILVSDGKEITVNVCEECNKVWPELSVPTLPPGLELYVPIEN